MYKQSKNNKRNARKSRVCLFFSVISCKTCTRKTHSNIGNWKALIYLAFCRHFPSNRGESSKRQTIDSSLYSSTGGLSIRHANRPIGAWTKSTLLGLVCQILVFLAQVKLFVPTKYIPVNCNNNAVCLGSEFRKNSNSLIRTRLEAKK